ncbi:histone-fold-containing protein [Gorgonomyces haynaldii]|nr:histone-fold-containing protein [Gorgonomyces haynaldii]
MDENDISTGTGGDEDLTLPKATLAKFIQDLLPAEMSCTKETKELLQECCVEFIHLVSSEATEICDKGQKKTIAGDHVMSALKNLGFEEYNAELQSLVNEHQQVTKEREKKQSKKLENSGMTQEEIIASQEALFAKARERMQMQNQQ